MSIDINNFNVHTNTFEDENDNNLFDASSFKKIEPSNIEDFFLNSPIRTDFVNNLSEVLQNSANKENVKPFSNTSTSQQRQKTTRNVSNEKKKKYSKYVYYKFFTKTFSRVYFTKK